MLQGNCQKTQVKGPIGGKSCAGAQFCPLSVEMSTCRIPRAPAKLTPTTVAVPTGSVLALSGARISDVVCTMAVVFQPWRCQNPGGELSTTSMLVSHFGFFMP